MLARTKQQQQCLQRGFSATNVWGLRFPREAQSRRDSCRRPLCTPIVRHVFSPRSPFGTFWVPKARKGPLPVPLPFPFRPGSRAVPVPVPFGPGGFFGGAPCSLCAAMSPSSVLYRFQRRVPFLACSPGTLDRVVHPMGPGRVPWPRGPPWTPEGGP